MKTNCTIAAAIVLAGLSSAAAANLYTQNFDSMGTTGTTPPAGWSVWYIAGTGSSLLAPTSAEMAAALAGSSTLVVWNQTSPSTTFPQQAGNMGSTATDPNRLLGTSPTSDQGDILQLSLNNASGSAITTIGLTFDMKTMAPGTLKEGFPATDELPGYRFYYLDGSTWVHLSSLDLTSDGTASAEFNFSTPVANGGMMEFRWFDDNADSYSPDPMIAIDNVTVYIPEPTTLSLVVVGALALICRRRTA